MPADGGLSLTGDWAEATRIAKTLVDRFEKAVDRAVLKEANYLRGQMVKGITSGAPGGNPFKPLSPMTLALRSAGGFGGSKPLIGRTSALRMSIAVVRLGGGRVFVGVHRSAKGADGRSLLNIAKLMEFGGESTHTLRQRRYLMARLREAGVQLEKGTSSVPIGGKLIIPARPFIGPIIAAHAKPADVKKRFIAEIARAMGGDLGRG
jgi:hypothetical protein